MRNGRTILLLSLVVALAGADETKTARIQGSWDPLSKEIIPRIASSAWDFGALVLVARKAGCRIDVSISMNVMPNPATASIRYSWEDANDSGTIGGNEVETETESVSNAKMAPAVRDLRRGLEAQTVASVANVFTSTNVKTVRVEGGYKLQVKPIDDANVRKALGFDVAYITVDENLLPVVVRAKDDAGGESTAKIRWQRCGGKFVPTNYFRTVSAESSRTEEDRTDVYELRDGIPLLQRIVIDSTISAITQVVTVHTELLFTEWDVQKRAKPLPPPGADEAEFEKPKPDEDEGLFGDETGRPERGAAADLRFLRRIESGQGAVGAIGFLPGGTRFVAGGARGPLILWDAAEGKEIRRFAPGGGEEGWYASLDVAPDGRSAVAVLQNVDDEMPDVLDDWVLLFDLEGGRAPREIGSRIPVVHCARFSPGGDRILLAGEKGEVEIFRAADLEAAGTLSISDNPVATVEWIALPRDPRATRVAALWDESKSVTLFDLRDPGKRTKLPMADLWVNALAFSADGRLLAGAAVARRLLLWDLERGGDPLVLEGHEAQVDCVAFLGPNPVTGSRDKTVRVWDAAGRKCLRTFDDAKEKVVALAASPDGRLLAATVADGGILVYRRE